MSVRATAGDDGPAGGPGSLVQFGDGREPHVVASAVWAGIVRYGRRDGVVAPAGVGVVDRGQHRNVLVACGWRVPAAASAESSIQEVADAEAGVVVGTAQVRSSDA